VVCAQRLAEKMHSKNVSRFLFIEIVFGFFIIGAAKTFFAKAGLSYCFNDCDVENTTIFLL